MRASCSVKSVVAQAAGVDRTASTSMLSQQQSVPSSTAESSVREALRRLEGALREAALLALADWQRTGVVAPALFRELAALPRPSFGRWNGLLAALRESRKIVLRTGDASEREKVHKAM